MGDPDGEGRGFDSAEEEAEYSHGFVVFHFLILAWFGGTVEYRCQDEADGFACAFEMLLNHFLLIMVAMNGRLFLALESQSHA